jgi:hypothetical protein
VTISRRIVVYLTVAAVCVTGLGLVGIFAGMYVERNARGYAIDALKKQFASDVTMGSLHLSLFPSVRATGDDLVLRFGGRTDLPPMIKVRRFTVTGGLTGFLRYPMHIGSVELAGLQVHIPPKEDKPESRPGSQTSGGSFVVDEVVADGATLEVRPRDARKIPLTFELKLLRLSSAGKSATMVFHTEVVNALPPGMIRSDGHIGPWSTEEPGGTPVSGQYTFRNADLGVFKGIKGTLFSNGKYQGELEKIEVQGMAEVPNLTLDFSGNPTRLSTTFAATVDGTNGDTVLHPVKAVLGTSEFEVSGSIERGAIAQGKEIDLSTKSVKGALQDFIRLAVKGSPPPMTGTLAFDGKIRIPPGVTPIIAKLQLNGQFNASRVKFNSPDVQEKMANLSHRAEADPRDHNPEVEGSLAGHFVLNNGIMSLPRLAFDLPGARVNLDGTYTLANGGINFKGTARLDATVSQMTTGIKSVLLKPVDPLFRHDGAGAVVPIAVSGNRGDPSFRLDIGRAMRGR